VSSDGSAPAPLVGRTTLTRADGAALISASNARFGFFNQPRLLMYSSVFAIMAAAFAMTGRGVAAPPLLALAIVCFALAFWVGRRTARLMSEGYGRGQEREIALDDAGVTVREPGMTVSWTWPRFERAIEMPDHITLVAGVSVVVILKRAFDAGAYGRVRELIAAKVPAPVAR
jgi:hypothetical protein